MKVGTISFYYPHLGGSGIMASKLAKELALRGDRSVVVSYEDTNNIPEMEKAGVYLYRAQEIGYDCFKSLPHTETLASKVANVVEKEKLDVIHSHYLMPHAVVGNIVKKMTGIPHIITGHGTDIHTIGDNPGLKPVLEWSLSEADKVTFVSDYLRRKCENIFKTDFGGDVVPNYVGNDLLHKKGKTYKLRKELGIPKDAVVISHASNFRPIKETIEIGWAAKKLLKNKENHGKVYFLFAGDSSASDYIRLKQDVTYNNLEEHFRFLGKQDSIDPLLLESDVAVLNSIREGCPLFVLEALSYKVPVASSAMGGVPEIVKHGYNGLLHEVGDLDHFVNNLQLMIDGKEMREEMGERGLEVILEGYTKDKIVDKYRSIYRTAIKNNKK